MSTKSEPDEIQSYLVDASNMRGGEAERVLFPQSTQEVAEILAQASREKTPVTVSGGGTGIVGGRVPAGGIVLATDRLNRIIEIRREERGGRARAEAGVVLAEFQRGVEAQGLLYPPDPTERSCFLGGTVATNASGARTFKYGPTRNYVERLRVALATGDSVDIRRGELRADDDGMIAIPLSGGRRIETKLPSYKMPRTRKHASGYYVEPRVDAIDLFIGSEGTLGVITEVEVKLLAKPEGVFGSVLFFDEEEKLLDFVSEAREISLNTRSRNLTDEADARALEYFDRNSLQFMREKFPHIPPAAEGAIFFEQETTAENEDALLEKWGALVEKHGALADDSWLALNEHDRARMREFRHALPVLVNERLARRGQRKVSTDMAVPDEDFPEMLKFYKETLRAHDLEFVIFGHIGDNHVHVNIMPRDDIEALSAREIYSQFIRRAVKVGGTISAEHGIGKLKRDYLRIRPSLHTRAREHFRGRVFKAVTSEEWRVTR